MDRIESNTYPRTSLHLRFTLQASAEQVFPLLCPVREYDWIANWRCELLHSRSGVAEDNCVFRTEQPDGSTSTWVVSHYAPPRRIEFVVIHPRLATRLNLSLYEENGGCVLDWDLTLSALVAMPDGELLRVAQARRETLGDRGAEIQYYLQHGSCRPVPARG